ncbi:Hypothetical protein ORPV_229 [Orpheovirus IHUMI-LCC2]|uniref:Uncharacterized protein n=1 Tax=Orpheovirus IHUMI-LCC2 TaxID=2023057 RepID=A0A2I2L3N4_9VIRU|nr:Hypothetical protein ORPV_229 [Orpheovirus IHUMI-LCC2]SNW62133.1 Hypothetical protein ORPV_229 [Orpheovirus IHUMI-LCC2]
MATRVEKVVSCLRRGNYDGAIWNVNTLINADNMEERMIGIGLDYYIRDLLGACERKNDALYLRLKNHIKNAKNGERMSVEKIGESGEIKYYLYGIYNLAGIC